MPYGYLITVLLVGVPTALCLVPIRQPGALGRFTFRVTFLLNEQPFLAIYWLIASTALMIAQGDATSLAGRASVVLAALVLIGLLVIVGRAARTRAQAEASLHEVIPGWGRSPRMKLPLARILLAPFHVRSSDVEHITDVSYGPFGERNLLDVYRPRSGVVGGPTFVHFHGGGFQSGHKDREARPLLYWLASRGWVCVSANYRLAPHVEFPDYLVDAKRVVAWLREHGEEYGADPSTIVVSGSSAGAHIATMLALTANDPRLQHGFEQADTSVSAAVPLYGYYGPVASRSGLPSSPLDYDAATAPPFFVIHGSNDSYVSPQGARDLVAKLRRESGQPVGYAELLGAQHTFDLFHSVRFDSVVDSVAEFIEWACVNAGR